MSYERHEHGMTDVANALRQESRRRLAEGETLDRRCVAVIGGGLCGLACAHELACRGVSVAIIATEDPGKAAAPSRNIVMDVLSTVSDTY